MKSVEEAKAQELLRQLSERISGLAIRAEDEEKARIEVEEENRRLRRRVNSLLQEPQRR